MASSFIFPCVFSLNSYLKEKKLSDCLTDREKLVELVADNEKLVELVADIIAKVGRAENANTQDRFAALRDGLTEWKACAQAFLDPHPNPGLIMQQVQVLEAAADKEWDRSQLQAADKKWTRAVCAMHENLSVTVKFLNMAGREVSQQVVPLFNTEVLDPTLIGSGPTTVENILGTLASDLNRQKTKHNDLVNDACNKVCEELVEKGIVNGEGRAEHPGWETTGGSTSIAGDGIFWKNYCDVEIDEGGEISEESKVVPDDRRVIHVWGQDAAGHLLLDISDDVLLSDAGFFLQMHLGDRFTPDSCVFVGPQSQNDGNPEKEEVQHSATSSLSCLGILDKGRLSKTILACPHAQRRAQLFELCSNISPNTRRMRGRVFATLHPLAWLDLIEKWCVGVGPGR